MNAVLEKIAEPFMPPLRTARQYSLHKFRRDIVAGLTVSVVELPQAMAYAMIAGVPPQYGIYASIIQGPIGALFSSSEHLYTGPTNTQSLLVASAVARIGGASSGEYLQLVFALTLLKGILQLAFALARTGDLARFVSRSVITGLTAGAGVLIAMGQLPAFLGIHSDPQRHLPGMLGVVERMWPHLPQTNLRAVGIGIGCVALVIVMRAISRFLPGALIAVIAAAACVVGMGWTAGQVPLVGELPAGLPHWNVPRLSWGQAEMLLGGALALALLGMVEPVAIVKSIAARTGERINANQEIFAQGLKDTVSSFFQCIPGSGSFTRAALAHAAGGQTRFAALYNGIFIAILFLLLGSWAKYIPAASLAAVLFVIAYGLIDWHYIARVAAASWQDLTVCTATFLATLLAPLEYAIFIGVFLNLGLYVRRASRLHVQEMVQKPGGVFLEMPLNSGQGAKRVMFLQVDGDLFFGLADELRNRLETLMNGGMRIAVLRLKNTHSIDATVLAALEDFTRELHACGGHIILCGVRPEVMEILDAYGLSRQIGVSNVFEAATSVFASSRRALDRAQELSGIPIDTTGIPAMDEDEQFNYQI